MSASIPTLRLALLGEEGAGKTTFFASYYANQSDRGPMVAAHGVRLRALDKAKGLMLRQRHEQMRDGRWPQGTDRSDVFDFDVFVDGLAEPGLRVSWLDYPGKWWMTRPEDRGEQEARRKALGELVQSQVVVVLLDGQRYLEEGGHYARSLFTRLHLVVQGMRADLKTFVSKPELPDIVILAVSKADRLPPEVTAADIYTHLIRDCGEELTQLTKAFGFDTAKTHFPETVILLSSAHAPEGRILDLSRTLSLDLIAPVAMLDILTRTARKAAPSKVFGPLAAVLRSIGKAGTVLAGFGKKIKNPKLAALLAAMALLAEPLGRAGAEHLEEKLKEAKKRSDAVSAVAARLLMALKEAENTAAYYKPLP